MLARVTLTAFLAVASAGTLAAQASLYSLPLGDPNRRDKDVAVGIDTVTDTHSADVLVPDDLPARLKNIQLLLIGETHTSAEFHRVELRTIRTLHESGRPVIIGLEMFPVTAQAALDEWNRGGMSDRDFLDKSRWYETWGYDWDYYKDIFAYARENKIPVQAVNVPRDVIAAVGRNGLAKLTPEEAKYLPEGIIPLSPDHLAFFKASIGDGDSSHHPTTDDGWKTMLSAQAAWDAAMGLNAAQAWKRGGNAAAIMVVLVGSGHVAYDVGIVRQLRQWFTGGIASIIPVPVGTDGASPPMKVRASYADYVWGVLPESASTYPSLGVSIRDEGGNRRVTIVEPDSPGARAGLAVGDTLVSMDGKPLPDRATLNQLLADKGWGDKATFVVQRAGAQQTVVVYFRRS